MLILKPLIYDQTSANLVTAANHQHVSIVTVSMLTRAAWLLLTPWDLHGSKQFHALGDYSGQQIHQTSTQLWTFSLWELLNNDKGHMFSSILFVSCLHTSLQKYWNGKASSFIFTGHWRHSSSKSTDIYETKVQHSSFNLIAFTTGYIKHHRT